MNKKITTIDDLAVMIEKESRNNEKRFNAIEEKMATKQDLFRMEERITSAVGDSKTELKSHDKRILALEKIVKP
ncbi:MAG TPA: hypothetical protein VIJ29_04785 [Candidatus Paceibacterota bacterium]